MKENTIDLTSLENGTTDKIVLDNTYNFPKEYYENSSILDLKNIKVTGEISLVPSEEDINELNEFVKCNITGIMIIEDSISLEPVEYPFSIEYDDILEENCKKNKNTLDIFQFLWENIVLEIPLRFTKVKDLSKFHGDGWKLISEDDLTASNNPFGDLLKNFKEE